MSTSSAPNGSAVSYFRENVLRDTDDCIIWPYSTDKDGYGQVRLSGRTNYVHILACILWNGLRPEGALAAHGPCHNRRCFNGRHLQWETPVDNQKDRIRDNTAPRGSGHSQAKLTEDQVLAMRSRRAEGATVRQISDEFSVPFGTVNNIIYRRSWKHV